MAAAKAAAAAKAERELTEENDTEHGDAPSGHTSNRSVESELELEEAVLAARDPSSSYSYIV